VGIYISSLTSRAKPKVTFYIFSACMLLIYSDKRECSKSWLYAYEIRLLSMPDYESRR
jgi:hypothetical protein